MHVEPELLTVIEAAEKLRVSRADAYRMVARGELPSVRLGQYNKILRVPVRSVQELIAERMDQQAQVGA